MAVPPALVVNFSFNPPLVSIAGPVKESTISKLSELLPQLSTNSCHGRRSPPVFVPHDIPVRHYILDMASLMSNEPSKMAMMLAVLDCLEDEGCWTMRDCHATLYDYVEHHTFFFTMKSRIWKYIFFSSSVSWFFFLSERGNRSFFLFFVWEMSCSGV